jgi:pyruvate/2-oxoacid:ferredoxin oxidoreductase alpha subunit
VWTDQNDSLSQRDTGWIQLYCETNQEVLDTTIQAFKLAERVDIPVMVVLDAFFLSHTSEPVDIPEQADVDAFLPKRIARQKLDVDAPHAFGALTTPAVYMEMRLRQQEAMADAREAMIAIDAEWGKQFGRSYGPIECYRTEGADLVLMTSGTITSTARYVINQLRDDGHKVGLVKVKMFRPFPTEDLRKALGGVKDVAVLDRNISPGHCGIFAEETRAALYDLPEAKRPRVHGYIVGLGGRDVTPDTIMDCVGKARAAAKAAEPEPEDVWVGVKS